MTEGDALYQAILAEPDQDDLRLIYADWLDDHGQPERAEFIRVQVELAALLARQAQLLRARPAEPDPLPAMTEIIYRRGFIDEVRAPLADLEKHLPAVVKLHPVTRATATDKEPEAYESGIVAWTFFHDHIHDAITGFPYSLPARLCDRWTQGAHSETVTAPNAQAALDYLSQALLTNARKPPVVMDGRIYRCFSDACGYSCTAIERNTRRYTYCPICHQTLIIA